ncbi:MAG TPA: hypothetical protein VF691_02430 [Cytophagaceae bacterium]|jgi:hypothetical protein
MQNTLSLQEFTFEYDATELPPPYAHFLKISGSIIDNAVAVNTEFHYTDREELSEEDILAEGFTADDDFTWSGELPLIWRDVLEALPSSPKEGKWDSIATIEVELVDKFQGNQVIRNDNRYYYFSQELLQASLEKSGREKPLQINYCTVQKNNTLEISRFSLHFSFTERAAKLADLASDKSITLGWEAGQALLKKIFMLDFIPEQADEQLPSVPGDYIDPGDGLWYKLSHAALNPGKKDIAKGLIEEFSILNESFNK